MINLKSKFVEDKYNELLDLGNIENDLYDKFNVKKGLRNANGTGVLVELTKVANVHGYEIDANGNKIDSEGLLSFRGVDIYDLARIDKSVYGYEKTCYLLLFGRLPNDEEFEQFKQIISDCYELPQEFINNIITRGVSENLMNHIMRSILALYTFDNDPDNTDPLQTLEKGISIIAKLPSIVSYSLQAKRHYLDYKTLHIRRPRKDFSIAENLLYMSRNHGAFNQMEAETLDLALMIHAEHGGGNNSAFANVVVASTGTDIYSAMTASLGSLKGPRHGGANGAVEDMMAEVINAVGVNATDDDLRMIANKLLDKKFYDNTGLIYGIGHAVYTLSDPRTILLKAKAKELAIMKDKLDLFDLYDRFERIAIEELKKRKGPNFHTCANVDFYSGLTYKLLNIPRDLYTPIFACARMVGWLAHNVEDKLYCNKIIRPAAKYVGEYKKID